MYAQISDDLIEEKAYLFDIGKVYIIKKFVVENSRRTYRAVDRDLMIEIAEHTSAEVVTNPPRTIPEYIYNITPFSAIRPVQVVFKYTGKAHKQAISCNKHSCYSQCCMLTLC